MAPFSVYVHIPFCRHKCPYCDFNTYAVATIPEREYTDAILAELDFRATRTEWSDRAVQSIYFGGGTPSLFKPSSIGRILNVIKTRFPLTENIEISLEANPGTVSQDGLNELVSFGLNRISFGAQSFSPHLLRSLGRDHESAHIQAAVAAATGAGISNLNIDLIYGIPGQTIDELHYDLKEAIALNPSHVSVYGLTVEPGTPYYQSFKKGILKLPPEEGVIEMIQTINKFLPESGYEHYEISNFAQAGKQARHNLAYWNCNDYIGLGAGAHSFSAESYGDGGARGIRWANFALPSKYIAQATSSGNAESWRDNLSLSDRIFEYFFLGLRKIEGVSLSAFEAAFNVSIVACYANLLTILASEQLALIEGDYLKLTEKGILLADSVIENFATPKIDSINTLSLMNKSLIKRNVIKPLPVSKDVVNQ